jgi:hypothetical protein
VCRWFIISQTLDYNISNIGFLLHQKSLSYDIRM